MKQLITILFALRLAQAQAQESKVVITNGSEVSPYFATVFNNGTFMPGKGLAGIFSKTIHPGVSIGRRFIYRNSARTALFQTARIGYFYHQFSQHAIQIYTELGYRYKIATKFYAEVTPTVGYLHAIPDVQQFKLENGKYVEVAKYGRPQLMASLGLSAGYNFHKSTSMPFGLFLQYQFWLQMPFVNKYVPMLPNNSLHLGVNLFLFQPKQFQR